MASISRLNELMDQSVLTDKMPVMFIGHGSPMNAIEDNKYTRKWKELGRNLPTPKAILSVSAHWLTHGTTKVTAMQMPKTIHDFGGFPSELYHQNYPAPGTPEFAEETIKLIQNTHVSADHEWGLDHGTWSVLLPMFPKSNIPVYQLSIDYSKPPQYHFEIAAYLKSLREKGVLIIGSGNVVHNLRTLEFNRDPYDWAIEFDTKIASFLDKGDHSSLVNFSKLGSIAKMAQPMWDHYLPLIYSIALRDRMIILNISIPPLIWDLFLCVPLF